MKELPESPFRRVSEALRARGIVLTPGAGEYILNYKHGSAATEYRTDDLQDALEHGLAMNDPPLIEPPLGPMGSDRAKMFRQNKLVAAKRAKRDRLKAKSAVAHAKSAEELLREF